MSRIAAAIGLLALLSIGVHADGGQSRIAAVSGEAHVLLRDDINKAWIPARANMPLREDDRVRTGAQGRVEIALKDGGFIELQPRTSLHFVELKPTSAVFGLNFGTLLAKFQKLGQRRPTQVRTPTVVASVRGTEMGVYSEGEESVSRVAVFAEGEVEVESSGRGDVVVLKNNKETELAVGARLTPPSDIKFFKFAQNRMDFLRKRQKYFQDRFRGKYGLPAKP